MNQPSRAEKFVLPDGVRKLTFTRDTKVANAGTYIVQKEDHTLGNIVRMQLHRDPNVVFAGYQVPHPSDNRIVIKVRRPETLSEIRVCLSPPIDRTGASMPTETHPPSTPAGAHQQKLVSHAGDDRIRELPVRRGEPFVDKENDPFDDD